MNESSNRSFNRSTRRRLAIALLLASLACSANADDSAETVNEVTTSKQVQTAMAWELPVNACKRPKAPGQRKEIIDSQGVTREEWDVDYYTLKRYNRKEQRWEHCVDKYKTALKKNFTTLKDSAHYGLSKQQAAVILGKMKTIQTVLQSPAGLDEQD